MEDADFWMNQPTVDVLIAAYLLAGEPLPQELSHSVNDTSYPPRVVAMIRLIKERTGAVVRVARAKGGVPPPTTISQMEFHQLVDEQGSLRRIAVEAATNGSKQDGGLKSRERNNLLRIIRALDAMNPKPLPQTGYAESVRTSLEELGLQAVSDDTIRKAIEDARKLDS